METVALTAILGVVAKNLVETLKHLADYGPDDTYSRHKGVFSLLAPVLLGVVAFIAQNQGVVIDVFSQLGVDTGDNTAFAAVLSGVVAGFLAPEAYDVQGVIKSKR